MGITQSQRRCRRILSQDKCDTLEVLLPQLDFARPTSPEQETKLLKRVAILCFCFDHEDAEAAWELV